MSLTFSMGEYLAEFPTDRLYAGNHMWALPIANGHRFGFTAYAVRLLQDVYFLDWIVDAPLPVVEKQEIGHIESQKAEASLFSPLGGELTRFNERLIRDPSGINVDKYGEGWLLEIQGPDEGLLTPEQYIEHLAEAWEVTQRTIKGQMNES